MSTYIIDYGDGPRKAEVSTVEEWDAFVEKALEESREFGAPFAAHMYTPAFYDNYRGPVLLFCVGSEVSLLQYDNAHVAGDVNADDQQWWYGNQWTFGRHGEMVSAEVALHAVREFVRTGVRPTNVEWVEE